MATKIKNPMMQRMLKATSTADAAILSESELFNNKDIIKLDIPIINLAFSGDLDSGLTNGLILLAGKPKSFKTILGLNCVKAYLDKYEDAICIFFDNEGGATPDTLRSLGIDTERVLHIPIENLEQLRFDIVKQLTEIKRGDRVIFMVDSFSNIASIKEIDDANDGKSTADLTKSRILKSITRIITPMLLSRNISCIGIAHTYDTLEIYSKQVVSGGLGIIYNANSVFIVSKSQEKDSDGDLSGWNFTLNVEKSRYVREKSKFPFTVLYDSGIQKYSGLLDIALELGRVIKPNNGWYSRVDDEGVVEDKKWRAKDTGCAEFWDILLNSNSFKKLVTERYKLSSHSESKEDMTVEEAIDDLED